MALKDITIRETARTQRSMTMTGASTTQRIKTVLHPESYDAGFEAAGQHT
jgi:hypothetical protein